ncbi:transposase [Lentibacillus cibarius]|nr:transposase [Lentibacillus cibarius]
MKRQQYSQGFKAQVAKEALEVGNKRLVTRRYEISDTMIYRWIR